MAGVELHPRSGRIRTVLGLFIVAAAMVAVIVSGAPWTLGFLLSAGLAATAAGLAAARGRPGRKWRALRPLETGSLEIALEMTDSSGVRRRCVRRGPVFTSPWFVSFRAVAPGGPVFRVALFADELGRDDFRRLLAWLRHGVA
ncbi:MAG: hypothetical protein RQ847_03565 [Wenzhouxiangellaceae bacterium]|nr:hypothetical protein [Wenzhouxiangellaceae bacterium]